ncbi:D-alanyl-D-alanine carboxypeptidase [Fulvivirga ulvae]|uniref:D-alanyl-D-alanine carboxypeptidase/D-alanyl-D-alanine-endopeptidase n=1 Tax=Fulvivirga ulvae TaxID=2904245 RepID=UPI001F188716|nr:D-alanyl-D-alanine carboxypeptidase [Fulvivirga ulvae]UII34048.1 D-alanyl-D-alanine carboxypeptidase [Fulvivirga ulvae]
MKFNLILAVILLMAAFSCSSIKGRKEILNSVRAFETRYQHHSGLVIYDIEKDKFLLDYHGDKYFIPASNTKILTLFASLKILGDSVPGLYYIEHGDSLIFWGSGDPSLLNKDLPASRVYDFLKNTKKQLYFSSSNYYNDHFGPGWAWDDYLYSFSAEKSPLPLYGNLFTVSKAKQDSHLNLEQPFFKQFFWLGDTVTTETILVRDVSSNNTFYFPSYSEKEFKEQLPFHYSDYLLVSALSDTLNRNVSLINHPLPENYHTISSIPVDSAYKVMMQESDNFIAEQLMLINAGIVTDSLKTENAIDYAMTHYLSDMPDEPVWVDASGLSRYNLFTPRSMVWVWHEIYKSIPSDRLFAILSVGGQSGTLKKYYKNATPYIFGKTGTLSNNHNISGYLRTKKGKLYIFAFMNNNYPIKAAVVKKEMEQILRKVYQNN